MKKIKSIIVLVALIIPVWTFMVYFYFGLPEGGLVRDTGSLIGYRVPVIRNLFTRSLLLSDELIIFLLQIFDRGWVVYFSEEEITSLQQVLNRVSAKDKLTSDEAFKLGQIWKKINDQRPWLPTLEYSIHPWVKTADRLRHLRSQSWKILIEMAKHRVSVVVTVNPSDYRIWQIEFHDEVAFMVTLDRIKIIAPSNKILYLAVDSDISNSYLMREESLGEYVPISEISRELAPMTLSGDVDDVSDIQFTFRNGITQTTFAPRAIRFIDERDKI